MRRHDWRHVAAAVSLAALVGACGGGGDGGIVVAAGGSDAVAGGQPTGDGALPSSALQGVEGLVAFARQLIAQTGDTAEPVALGSAVLPTSDTAEPMALN